MYQEDEYTDFSCSTAIERLSRDVETVLRAWHIDKGSDHHVTTVQRKEVPFGGISTTLSLIRSNPIVWNIPLMTMDGDRSSVSIDLELSLWDAPIMTSAMSVNSDSMTSLSSQLVRSLQQRLLLQQSAMHYENVAPIVLPNDSLFDNFSRLFGIGQHISLAPIQADPLPPLLIESIGSHVVLRHQHAFPSNIVSQNSHDSVLPTSSTGQEGIATLVLMSTLSGWLQNALNLATSNCRCGIPAFGIWGDYTPDKEYTSNGDAIHEGQPELEWKTSESASRSGDGPLGINKAKNVDGMSRQRDQLVGTTIQASFAEDQFHADDPQKQILELQNIELNYGIANQQYHGGASIGTPSASPTGASQGSLGGTGGSVMPNPTFEGGPSYLEEAEFRNAPGKRQKHSGKSIFPKWTKAIGRVSLPPPPRPDQRKAQRNHACNQQYIPPLICATVSSSLASQAMPVQVNSMTSTMLVSGTRIGSDEGNARNSLPASRDHHTLRMRTNTSSNQLSIWANALLKHCPGESTCSLHGARHVFGWFKPTQKSFTSKEKMRRMSRSARASAYWRIAQEWREINTALTSTPRPDDTEFVIYQKHCQAHAMDVLEEAMQVSPFHSRNTDQIPPVWGPVDDPVAAVYATVTWNSKITRSSTSSMLDLSMTRIEPILSFPLRIRSRRPLSRQDWIEMEASVESTILDPLSTASRFLIEVHYDRDTPVATLTTTQRCLLASLIRSATLPGETLLHHLTSSDLVALWNDDAGTLVATKLAEKSKVGPSTISIVKAMDWSSIMKDMITLEEAEAIVHAVLQGDIMAGFPSSPGDTFLPNDDLCRPFPSAAPYGRLLSILFAHMARLRAMSSMILVWNVFIQEIRRRWHARESLPNMQFVAGLDPHPLDLYQKQRSFATIGHKANFASFLNGSEPDPDDYNCLIGQKLQVFQIGVECLVSQELLESEVLERFLDQGQVPHATTDRNRTSEKNDSPSTKVAGSDMLQYDPLNVSDSMNRTRGGKWPKSRRSMISQASSAGERRDYGPPAIDSDLEFWVMDEPGYAPRDESLPFEAHQTDDIGFDFVAPPPKDLDELDVSETSLEYRRRSMIVDNVPDVDTWEGTIMEGDEDDFHDEEASMASQSTTCSLSQAYFDAAEAGSIFSMKHGFVNMDTVVNVSDTRRRPGARCPVQGIALRATGDQVYAPYLQRPYPLTDDLLLERKHMLAAEQRNGENRRQVLQNRIEIAHRLQRPKLMSDMSSFKAANPNACLDDFTKWYGNPGSPLDDYDDEPFQDDVSIADAYYESAAKKLDKASEAMKILTATREFWASTWEAARPIPAAEQPPLFDFETTVEQALDYLEQLHPASLLNQIIAVNMSSAYFALVSSTEDVRKIPLVERTLLKLRTTIEKALALLSNDATGALFQTNVDAASTATATANQHISEESLFACETVCNLMSVAETLTSRAVSLLAKFPSQYQMVEELLKLRDGTQVALTAPSGRKGFLEAIRQQQLAYQCKNSICIATLPDPIVREYVLQNKNDEQPCQLSVRFGNPDKYLDRVDGVEGGVLMALLKTKIE